MFSLNYFFLSSLTSDWQLMPKIFFVSLIVSWEILKHMLLVLWGNNFGVEHWPYVSNGVMETDENRFKVPKKFSFELFVFYFFILIY